MPNSLLWKFTDSSTHGVKIRNFYRAKIYDSSFKCRWRRLKRIFLHQDITVLSRLVRDFRKSGVSFFTYEKLLFLFFSHQKFLFKPSYISYRAPKQHIPSIIFQEKFPRTKQIFNSILGCLNENSSNCILAFLVSALHVLIGSLLNKLYILKFVSLMKFWATIIQGNKINFQKQIEFFQRYWNSGSYPFGYHPKFPATNLL